MERAQNTKPKRGVIGRLREAEILILEAREKIELRKKAEIQIPDEWALKLKKIEKLLAEVRQIEDYDQRERNHINTKPTAWKKFTDKILTVEHQSQQLFGKTCNFGILLDILAAFSVKYGFKCGRNISEKGNKFLLVDLPTGQISIKISEKRYKNMEWLDIIEPPLFDGHTSKEKSQRVDEFVTIAKSGSANHRP